MRVVFTARGRADLLAQVQWLAERAPAAARRAADRLHLQLALLAEFPHAAPAIDDHHREAVIAFGRDGFVVRYRLAEDAVIVVRVFHGRQARGPG